jgi:hypothetical protein
MAVMFAPPRAAVSRDGPLALATFYYPGRSAGDRVEAVALAKALRPLTRSSP